MKVAGVDGCKKGWFAIVTVDEKFTSAHFFESFSDLPEALAGARIIGVDIPIGLLEDSFRKADLEAKKFLGKRSSSIFLTPPRRVLEEQTYKKSNKLARELGKGVSKQSYNLRDKIFDVEPHAATNTRIVEVHPEISFCEMAGLPLASSKKTWDGLLERLDLLKKVGLDLVKGLPKSGTGVSPDDVVDAAAAAWTASRVAQGKALTLPQSPSERWEGRPIAIWR
jgi:predicted RNase H-like nuclease